MPAAAILADLGVEVTPMLVIEGLYGLLAPQLATRRAGRRERRPL